MPEKDTQDPIHGPSNQRISMDRDHGRGGPTRTPAINHKAGKMRWFGHVNRSTGLAKLNRQGSVEGMRGRGRPRTTWLDNIMAWTGKTGEELNKLSQDRGKWKQITYALQLLPIRRPHDRFGQGIGKR